MAILKEQWDGLIKTFTIRNFVQAEFKYQEHKIVIQKEIKSATKNYFVVFIDGSIDASWMHPKKETFNPLVKLFWDHYNRLIYTNKQIKQFEKDVGKRHLKMHHPDVYTKRHDFYCPTFSSLKKLVNQFKKIEGLELVSEDFL